MLAKLPNTFVANEIPYTDIGRKIRRDKATKYFLSISANMDLIYEILNVCDNAIATTKNAYSIRFQTAPSVTYASVEFDDKTIKNKIDALQNMYFIDDNGYVLLSERCFVFVGGNETQQQIPQDDKSKKNWRDMWYERYDKD
jgi:hypothetical protein